MGISFRVAGLRFTPSIMRAKRCRPRRGRPRLPLLFALPETPGCARLLLAVRQCAAVAARPRKCARVAACATRCRACGRHVREVHLDGLDRHEERLGDLLVTHVFGGHDARRVARSAVSASAPLREDHCADALRLRRAPRCRARRALSRRSRCASSTPSRSSSRASLRRLLRRRAAPRSTNARACSSRAGDGCERRRQLLATTPRRSGAAFHQAESAQRDPDRSSCTPPTREFELCDRELTCFAR